jgi:16S rRNA (cytidine1402-2'-O)-methyltransferase
MNRFTFEGFLPPKKGRQTILKKLAEEDRTMIIYESPHRLLKTVQEFVQYFGADRQGCVSRELSKMFEENAHGTLQELVEHFQKKDVKGEIVIVLAGKE